MRFALFADEVGTTHNRDSTANRAEQDRAEVRLKREIELTQHVQCQLILLDAVQRERGRHHHGGRRRGGIRVNNNRGRTPMERRVGQIDVGQEEDE